MAYSESDIKAFPKHIREQINKDLLNNKSHQSIVDAVSKKQNKALESYQAYANVVSDTQGMNKTESRFYTYLRSHSDIVHIGFNSWRCKLATTQAKDAWYKPDFFVIRDSGRVEIYEVKGFWRSRDRVRIKVAASLYPYFNWYGAMLEKGEWKFERF